MELRVQCSFFAGGGGNGGFSRGGGKSATADKTGAKGDNRERPRMW